eukprot:TRINITY_DN16723_c0_g5_i7.p1 TRINITY_DN16723_c0_g5~~TRINITY_DN16723_c0_g5_i7.p1  ORF type:complete len:268 (-),score=68.63 TRINITY_DN16723_c0_g5_i7:128-931(-)
MVKEVISKHEINTRRSEIAKLDDEWGGLVLWLLKVHEQYEFQLQTNNLMAKVKAIAAKRNDYVGVLYYLQEEIKSLRDKKVKLEKYKSFIQENIKILETFPTKSYKLESMEALMQVSATFDRCRIANMVAQSNSISFSSVDDSDFSLFLSSLPHVGRRHVTEESDPCLRKEVVRSRWGKNVKVNKAEDSVLQKLVVSGDNDPQNEFEAAELLVNKDLADIRSKDGEVKENCAYIIEQSDNMSKPLTRLKSAKRKEKKKCFWFCMCSK